MEALANGKNGFIEFTPSVLWAAVRVYYEETYDVASNTSDLTVTSIQVKSTNYQDVDYYADGVIAVDGTKILTLSSSAGNASVSVHSRNSWYPIWDSAKNAAVTAQLTGIPHENDGTRQVRIDLTGNRFQRFAFYTVDGLDGNGWGVKESQSLALTDIPRASAIAATDAMVGAVSTVAVTRRNADYCHSVAFTFADLSGWLDADGSILDEEKKLTASGIPFAIPDSFYGQLTDAAYGNCLLRCTTYLGDTQIGDVQETAFRVTADPAVCAPLVTGTVQDVNPVTVALTGDGSRLIRYGSDALCTISAQAQAGAAIQTKSIAGTAVAGDSRTLEKAETGTVAFSATDSRGYSASVAVTADMIPYIPLTLHPEAKRTDPTSGEVALTVRGNYYNGSFGAQSNTLTLSYALGEQTGQLEAVLDGNTYRAQILLSGMDYRSSHSITVTARDAIGTASCPVTVGKGIPVFDWGEDDFAFHVPVALEQGFTVQGKALTDLVYPVGCVYLSGTDTDPAGVFGGTWVAVENELGLQLWQRTG